MIERAACLTLLSFVASGAAAAPPLRRLPPECAPYAAAGGAADPNEAERSWNALYRSGYESVERGDLEGAQASICAALAHAAGFGPRDWRFAETLDELGLIHFLRGERELSISVQAGAVAEMLLAEGPRAPGAKAYACASVASYATRLGYPLSHAGRGEEARNIEATPYRVFTLGLVAADRQMADRLGWLISEYLALEDLEAARALQEIVDRAVAEAPEQR